jgi:hypothetical protein
MVGFMRFASIFFVFAFAVSAFSNTGARAASVTYNFTALITNAQNYGTWSGIPDISAGLTLGVSTVNGTITYDTTQAASSMGSGETGYANGPMTMSVTTPASGLVSFMTGTPAAQPWVRVRNNYFGFDHLSFQTFGQTFASPGLYFDYMSVNLSDGTSTAITNNSLPTSIDLADWTTSYFSLQLSEHEQRFFQGNPYVANRGTRQITGHIVSLSQVTVAAVPIPAAGLALLTALAGLGFIRRRAAFS